MNVDVLCLVFLNGNKVVWLLFTRFLEDIFFCTIHVHVYIILYITLLV